MEKKNDPSTETNNTEAGTITEKSIGVFDSGIGGLTVVKQILDILPEENLIYLGDTARVPYGTKSRDTVIKYAESNTNFLISKGIKILIVACNTASAHSLESLKNLLDIPVIGVIEPGARKAAEITQNGNIGVIGTPSTIRSGAYPDILGSIDSSFNVYSKPCPLFVPLAEEGLYDDPITNLVAEKYLEEIMNKNIDVLILGCTHYPLLKETISKVTGEEITLVDSAEETSKQLYNTLQSGNNFRNKNGSPFNEFYLTDNSESFINIAGAFLGKEIDNIKLVDLNS